MVMNLFVVVPFYNEELLIADTLNALAAQSDKDFSLVLVDNNSSDGSHKSIVKFIADHPEMNITIIEELTKGTGAASDTGFRFAIENGATHVARTDADSLPEQTWIEKIKTYFEEGSLFVGGKIKPRTDEPFYKIRDSVVIPLWLILSNISMKYLYRHKENKYPLFMIAGFNMAVESKTYIEVGGFPRSSIAELDEDRELHLKICKTIDKCQAAYAKDAVVRTSTRRVNAYGYIKTILWYWDKKVKPDNVDIRY